MKKAALFIFILLLGSVLWAQQKFALVIGNANYNGILGLRNPVNDANDMETALRALGFNVEKVLNGNLDQMEAAIIRLKNRLSGSRNSYGFFFYAGHGVQSEGVNYLIPVDASTILSESHLRQRAVSLQTLLDNLGEAGNELNMVVLDSCRDNPFSWSRSGSRGLTVVTHAPSGSIVMLAAGEGQTASDGTGQNGLFTSHLLANLRTSGLSVLEVFIRTMGSVVNATGGSQYPEIFLRYPGAASAYLGTQPSPNPNPNPGPNPNPVPNPNPQPSPVNFVLVEGGTFQMGSYDGDDNDERPVHTVIVSSFFMSKYEVTQKEWFEIMGTTLRQQRDMEDRSWSLAGEGDNNPMYYVNWLEAVEYCNKRSQREGLTPAYSGSGNNITCNWNANGYRLPTEAEWEYAAKGGNRDTIVYEFSGSNNADAVAWNDFYLVSPQPVGTKAPNILGLYDMSGNVAEWCWDGYGNYSSGTQINPHGASPGAYSGSYRVTRGGGWSIFSDIRSAARWGLPLSIRGGYGDVGFRVVRNAPGSN
jgi:formylglycine-generating enzyme required for sulfatase activity